MLLTYKTILSQKTQLTTDVYLYHFDLIDPKEISFKAGQYLMIKIPTDKGPISRLYSIASSGAEKNSIELIIQIIPGGLASNYLLNLEIGNEMIFQGPAGIFVLNENNRPKVFLTTGTGIAPIKSMLDNSQLTAGNYSLFWGLKTYKDIYLLDELKKFNPKICLSREQNLDMIPENDKKYFELGHIDNCLVRQNENQKLKIENFDYYVCGGRQTVESLRLFLINRGVLPENIYSEKF